MKVMAEAKLSVDIKVPTQFQTTACAIKGAADALEASTFLFVIFDIPLICPGAFSTEIYSDFYKKLGCTIQFLRQIADMPSS